MNGLFLFYKLFVFQKTNVNYLHEFTLGKGLLAYIVAAACFYFNRPRAVISRYQNQITFPKGIKISFDQVSGIVCFERDDHDKISPGKWFDVYLVVPPGIVTSVVPLVKQNF